MGREAGVGEVLQERHERLPTRRATGSCVDLTERGAAWGGVGVQVGPEPVGDVVGDRACRSVDPSPRGRSPAASRPGPGSPRRAAAGTRPRRRSRERGARGHRGRGGAAPAARTTAACSTRYASALTTRSSPRSSGSASNASTITRAWARFTSPAPSASAVCVHCDPRAAANAACRRTVPWLSRVWCRQPGRGGPVTGLLGDVVGGCEDPQPFGLGTCLITRATRSRNSCLSPAVRNSGLIAASSSSPRSTRSRGAAYVLDIGQSKHRPPTALRPQNPLSTRDSRNSLRTDSRCGPAQSRRTPCRREGEAATTRGARRRNRPRPRSPGT